MEQREGQGAKGPGSEGSREREGHGANKPGSESSREQIGQGSIGRFAPGSELAWERKGCESVLTSGLGWWSTVGLGIKGLYPVIARLYRNHQSLKIDCDDISKGQF